MKQNKNKIMFIFMLFIMLFFIGISDVFASTVEVPAEVIEKAKEVNYGYDNYIILYYADTGEFIIPYKLFTPDASTYPNNFWTYTNFGGRYYGFVSPAGLCDLKQVIYKDGVFTDCNISNPIGTNDKYVSDYYSLSGDHVYREIVYAGKDVLYSGVEGYEDGTVFFQAPVQEQGLTILTLETAGQIPETMGKVLKVIIPVGLIILSMVLVISLVKSVILRAR